MSREVLITTPENIALEYELAGLGTRFVACLIDTLIQVLAVLLGLIVFFILRSVLLTLLQAAHFIALAHFFQQFLQFEPEIFVYLIILFILVYFCWFEAKWRGQTPGKRVMGLRVMREGGYPINGYGAVMRNVLRVVDFLPAIYCVGIFSILLTANYQRVGDLVGGTLIVKQRAPQSLAGLLRVAQILPEHLDPKALAIIGRHAYELTPDEYRAVRHFTDRRRQLDWNAQQISAIKIAVPLMERLQIVPPTDAREVNYADLLEYLAVAYEQARRPK